MGTWRWKKISLFISLAGSKSNHLSYSICYPVGIFQISQKVYASGVLWRRNPTSYYYRGEVSKEILDGILNYLVASLTFC